MQQIRGLSPSIKTTHMQVHVRSKTLYPFYSHLFAIASIQRTRKIVFIFCLLERYKKNINKCKMIIGVYAMLSDFVPLKATLSIHYHRCFTYN